MVNINPAVPSLFTERSQSLHSYLLSLPVVITSRLLSHKLFPLLLGFALSNDCIAIITMFSILSPLRSFALLLLSTGLFVLRQYDNVAFAAPTLNARTVGSFSGQGNLVVHQGGEPNGCITDNGKWTTGGQCAVFSAAPQGAYATQLTTPAGKCGFDSAWNLVCEVENPNGPENWHVSMLSFSFTSVSFPMFSSFSIFHN